MRALGAAAMVAGVPVIGLVVLVLTDQATIIPALALILGTLIAALLLSLRWWRDVEA
ncbi:MAG: hypothetical protein JO157_13415, partial [Acetobacteraceae bacterium]|nr:hypothetical protein [Acetobacteraceae bacterium]